MIFHPHKYFDQQIEVIKHGTLTTALHLFGQTLLFSVRDAECQIAALLLLYFYILLFADAQTCF